jgi:hypothetical protein
MMLILIVMMGGCHTNSCTYPTFPQPSKKVLNNIKDINSSDVDNWMVDIYKLNLKLKEVNK